MRSARRLSLVAAGVLAVSACAPKQAYTPPTAPPVTAFKESVNWKPTQPRDDANRGEWWKAFGDPDLAALQERVKVSNLTLKAVQAQFAQAQAILRASRSALYPQVTAGPSYTNARPSGNRAVSTFHKDFDDYLLPASASWEADVWGRVRGTVEGSRNLAQASAADIETIRLSVHSDLATNYFSLRGLDRERQLLDAAVAAYAQALELTQNRFQGGLASQADVALAETQLETTRAQSIEIRVVRSTLEHAIAALIGQPASSFSIPVAPLMAAPPDIPTGLPSELLERRPDIAAAERRLAAASAQVGVTTASLYPILSLSGTIGFEASSFGSWLASASNFWSTGPALLVNVFDAGRRRANVDQAKFAFEQSAAVYQNAVLTAFREVEDQLAVLRILEEEAAVQARAVAAAERSLELANNRYRGGVVSYLEVITAQNAALTNQRTAVTLLTRRMNASVLLLRALGGDWQPSMLPALVAKK